jgi:hypothetical protein
MSGPALSPDPAALTRVRNSARIAPAGTIVAALTRRCCGVAEPAGPLRRRSVWRLGDRRSPAVTLTANAALATALRSSAPMRGPSDAAGHYRLAEVRECGDGRLYAGDSVPSPCGCRLFPGAMFAASSPWRLSGARPGRSLHGAIWPQAIALPQWRRRDFLPLGSHPARRRDARGAGSPIPRAGQESLLPPSSAALRP